MHRPDVFLPNCLCFIARARGRPVRSPVLLQGTHSRIRALGEDVPVTLLDAVGTGQLGCA